MGKGLWLQAGLLMHMGWEGVSHPKKPIQWLHTELLFKCVKAPTRKLLSVYHPARISLNNPTSLLLLLFTLPRALIASIQPNHSPWLSKGHFKGTLMNFLCIQTSSFRALTVLSSLWRHYAVNNHSWPLEDGPTINLLIIVSCCLFF